MGFELAIPAVTGGTSAALQGVELYRRLRAMFPGTEVDEQVLRVAFLDAEANLVLLDAVAYSGQTKSSDERFLQYAAALRAVA